MNISETHKIRPAGRHLLTIGRDLIQDQYAAIVELVKNAYDADSEDVEIAFHISENPSFNDSGELASQKSKYILKIELKDHGHGMSRDTVIGKWLVPSTDDKLRRGLSPKGRIMQGRKGVGRYAASILGSDLLLETVAEDGDKTIVYVQWSDFENAEFLDDVEVLVETQKTDEPSGTTLTITGYDEHIVVWDDKEIKSLRFELKKLIPPSIDSSSSEELASDLGFGHI